MWFTTDRPADVLVVADQALFRDALVALLSENDRTVVAASSVRIALRLLGRRPLVIVVDWEMPAVSGLDFCRLVRGTREGDHLIVFTMRNATAERAAARRAGADELVGASDSATLLLDRVGRGVEWIRSARSRA